MTIATIKADIKDYINTQVDVFKLKMIKTTEKIIANTILAIVLAILGLFILLFFSIAGACAISAYTGKLYLGFLLVGCFYLLIGVCIALLKQKLLDTPIIKALAEKLKYHGNEPLTHG